MAEVKKQMVEVKKSEKKQIKKRSVAQLAALGNKGLIALMVQRAFGLSKQNKFEGTELKGYSESSVGGMQYNLTKDGGKILTLEESSDEYKRVLASAKAAKTSVETDKYDTTVKSFINTVITLKSPRVSGVRSGSILKEFSFK